MLRTTLLPLTLAACAATPSSAQPVSSLYWSDGDSGNVNGVPFRLADVDAPETGGVGAAVGAAKCEKERELGYKAKEFIVNATKTGKVTITSTEERDDFDRTVMTLAIDGKDIGQLGVGAGFLRPYVFDGQRATMPKPDWCK